MEIIKIVLSPKANKSKLIEVIEMLKGVKSVSITSDKMTDDEYMAKQMSASRKSGKGDKRKVMDFLNK